MKHVIEKIAVFAHPKNGYEHDRELNRKLGLIEGNIYELVSEEDLGFHTLLDIKLPNGTIAKCLNSVCFDIYECLLDEDDRPKILGLAAKDD